ncbi:MAG: Smr/MutS family protein [Calditrichaeota bacterium]|nr:Smr/MutS family protein [Calditrichota bacterium]
MPADFFDDHEPIEYPIDGVLDLHTFSPADVKSLLPEYLRECKKRGIFQVRIIHGKGKGILRRRVHRILEALPDVLDYWQEESAGGWGATLVRLKEDD